MRIGLAFAFGIGAAATAGHSGVCAQTAVDQLSRPTTSVAIPPATASDKAPGVKQVSPSAAPLPEQPQAPAEQSAEIAQSVSSEEGRRVIVPAPPPEAVDACEAAALGRAAAPKGIDCNAILVADSRTRTSDLAEDALAPRERAVGNAEVSIRRLESADPEEIARRLASGYLVNAPAAQNVGRDQQQEQAPQTRSGIQIIPDPRQASGSPVQVIAP